MKHFKKRITRYYLAENKNLCFFVKLSKQNLLQLAKYVKKYESFEQTSH